MIKRFCIAIAAIGLFAVMAFVPPAINAASTPFDQLVQQAIKSGKVLDTDMGEFRSLSNIVPADTSQPHIADYFSAVGVPTSSGFGVTEISIVSENWQKDSAGNWCIDQWTFTLGADGHFADVTHDVLRETPDGTMIGLEYKTTSVNDAKANALLVSKLATWYAVENIPTS